jgi:lipid A ethanolaminephosphotransferase
MGSHVDYKTRIPSKFYKFKPIYKNDYTKSKSKLDNGYDNTIFYTDYFLSKLIDDLKYKNAFFIYTSDHGESLGEKSYGIFEKYGHSAPYKIAPKEQKNVPMIFWFSNKYINNYKLNINHIKRIINKKISHDYIFHSILGCGRFTSSYLKNELNICKFD